MFPGLEAIRLRSEKRIFYVIKWSPSDTAPRTYEPPDLKVAGMVAALIGLMLLGAIVGGLIGVGCGFAYVAVAHATSFEGYSGMLIFFGFGPGGAIVGALAFAALYLRSHLRTAR